ncbi:MAG: hypothetical protein U5N27_06780 [Rhizobium sp.]|nr:hypothetical protein [Rhizobium sp.]
MAPHHCATNLVFSYQNVTVILSSKTEPFDPIYARPPPTFLFLPSSIVKKQTDKTRQKSHPPNPKAGQQNQHNSQFRDLSEPVRRAVRRRLSFGEAAYTATPTNRQQPVFTKVQKIDMLLNILCFFPLMPIVGGK